MKKPTLALSFLFTFFQLSFSQVIFVNLHFPDDPGANDLFGNSMSISGEYLFVGASLSDDAYLGEDCGAVYVYRNSAGWGQTQKLQPWYQTNDVSFGNSVSVFGNYAIVGAYYDSYNEIYEGSAYIYYLNSGTNEWFAATILLPSGDTEGDLFGYDVVITDEYAAICALFDDESGAISGAVYLFGKDTGGTDNWGLVKKIFPDSPTGGLNFGYSIALKGDTLFVGATGDNTSGDYCGACFVYSKNEGGSNNWGSIDVLYADDANEYDNFGSKVYVDDNYLIIAAENAGVSNPGEGAVYVFEKNVSGFWEQQAKISSPLPEASSKFGSSITVAQGLVFVGASQEIGTYSNEGQVYSFSKSADTWSELTILYNSNSGENYYFGKSIASYESSVFVGVPQNTESSNSGLNGLIYEYYIDLSGVKTVDSNVFSVYPNPTSGMLNINIVKGQELDIAEIEIINVTGKVIYRKSRMPELQQIDFSSFGSGIYFLRVIVQKRIFIEKIVVN